MLIQIELNEFEERDLKEAMSILGVNTKRKCIRNMIYLFPLLANKYDKKVDEIKELKKEISMYEKRLKKVA